MRPSVSQLRKLRLAEGEKLSETAGRAGVSPQYLSEMERGVKEPSSEMIAAVAGALDTTLPELLTAIAEELVETQPAARRRPDLPRRLAQAGYPAAVRSSRTRSTSPYSTALAAVNTRAWSVSARNVSVLWPE